MPCKLVLTVDRWSLDFIGLPECPHDMGQASPRVNDPREGKLETSMSMT